MANLTKCTKCGIRIREYTLCSKCYSCYTNNTKRRGTVDYHDFVNINSSPEERKVYDIGNIYDNSVYCPKCADVIRSVNRRSYVTCKCWESFVDWWSWYCRKNPESIFVGSMFKQIDNG